MDELAMVKETQSDGSVRAYVDEDLKQEIALKLLEEIPNFPLKEAENNLRDLKIYILLFVRNMLYCKKEFSRGQ